MEKTGAVLQDRYDKSYEQYSLADEALKQNTMKVFFNVKIIVIW